MVTNIWDEKIDKCLAGGLIVLLVSGIILNILANYYQYKVKVIITRYSALPANTSLDL